MYFCYYGIFKVILMILEVWWYLEDFLGYLAQFANVTYEYFAQFLFLIIFFYKKKVITNIGAIRKFSYKHNYT